MMNTGSYLDPKKMNREEIINKAKEIQGWMKDIELAGLYDLAVEYVYPGDIVIEVGSWKGKSSFVLASVCKEKSAMLYCVDTFTGSELNEAHYKEALDMGASEFMRKYICKNLEGLPVEYIVRNSLEAHELIQNGSCALVFIDGNHTDPVITQDLDNYWPKVKSGGIYVCHDYCNICPDVKAAVDKKFPDLSKALKFADLIGIPKD
jgi:predicted O-methyltransferase YrrM